VYLKIRYPLEHATAVMEKSPAVPVATARICTLAAPLASCVGTRELTQTLHADSWAYFCFDGYDATQRERLQHGVRLSPPLHRRLHLLVVSREAGVIHEASIAGAWFGGAVPTQGDHGTRQLGRLGG
jgi:hypothetical protein